MEDRKLTVGFETLTAEAHRTRIVRLTLSGLLRAVTDRFEAIIDEADNGGPLKELWDAIDYGKCDNLWVSDANDDIQLECSGRAGILDGERPVFALLDWTRTQETAGAAR